MRDRFWILTGLILFLIGVTYPMWHNLRAGTRSAPPVLPLPAHEPECVAPAEYMRTSHMKLLLDWRDRVVRDDEHEYVSPSGKVYDMSLTGTCLSCHDKAEFCDQCHTYAGVRTIACWNCHLAPTAAKRSAP